MTVFFKLTIRPDDRWSGTGAWLWSVDFFVLFLFCSCFFFFFKERKVDSIPQSGDFVCVERVATSPLTSFFPYLLTTHV